MYAPIMLVENNYILFKLDPLLLGRGFFDIKVTQRANVHHSRDLGIFIRDKITPKGREKNYFWLLHPIKPFFHQWRKHTFLNSSEAYFKEGGGAYDL